MDPTKAFDFLKSVLPSMLKLGGDGLDAFVVIAVMVLAGVLFGVGIDQFVVVFLTVGLAWVYFWKRDRSDVHKERMAQIAIDKIEAEKGARVREKARKQLSKPDGSGNGAERDRT